MAYYWLIAVAFIAVSAADHDAGRVAVPFVIAMALVPAVYAEWLRVTRRDDS